MKQKCFLRMFVILCLALIAIALQGCTPIPNCSVSLYEVTKFDDTNDGVCSASDCSLREAVNNANVCPGHQTIHLPTGGYVLSIVGAGEDAAATGDLDITDDLTILGENAPSVNANGIDRVFEVFSPAVVDMEFIMVVEGNAQDGAGIFNHSELTFRGGSIQRNAAEVPAGGLGSSRGGGIFNGAYTLTLIDAHLSDNNADFGGGIFNQGTLNLINSGVVANKCEISGGGIENIGDATLDDATINDNRAEHSGGIFNQGTLMISHSTIRGNQAINQSGGGVYNSYGGETTITDSIIDANTAAVWGGGIFNTGLGSNLNMENVALTSNEAGLGGGIANERGEVEMIGCKLDSNVADQRGGGLWNNDEGEVIIYDSRFTNNTADLGGGIYNYGLTQLYRSSLSINTALGGYGGAIYNNEAMSRVLLRNVTLSGNMIVPSSAAGGAGIYNHGGDMLIEFATFTYNSPDGILNDAGGHFTMRSSILAHHTIANCTGAGSPSIGYNLENADSCGLIEPSDLTSTDPMLAPLALNGASTMTHALKPGSPAIDSGDPNNCISEDQRSIPRPQGAQCDRGAYESDVIVPMVPTIGPILTLVPTSTPTPMSMGPAKAIFIQNANCRRGPGRVYDVVTSLLAGQEVLIEGRSAPGLAPWWWILLPESRAHCWVSDVTVEKSGPVEDLPIIAALPTPTPTPEQGCTVRSATGAISCVVPCPEGAVPGDPCTP